LSVSFSARRAACSKQPRIAGKCNSFRFSTSAVLTWPTPLIAPPPRSQLDQTSFDLNSAVGPVGQFPHSLRRFAFGRFFSFCAVPPLFTKNFAPGSPRSDDSQLGRPRASPVFSFFRRISLFQSRSPTAGVQSLRQTLW